MAPRNQDVSLRGATLRESPLGQSTQENHWLPRPHRGEINGMDLFKALEANAGELFKQVGQIADLDQLTLVLAGTNMQQGLQSHQLPNNEHYLW